MMINVYLRIKKKKKSSLYFIDGTQCIIYPSNYHTPGKSSSPSKYRRGVGIILSDIDIEIGIILFQ